MGLLKYTPKGWKKVQKYLKNCKESEIDKIDITTLLQRLIKNGVVINAVPISDKWFEVDTESDLRIYKQKFEQSPIS